MVKKKIKLEKLQNLLYFILLIFLPTQLGIHFWPSFSLVNGIRVDYLSPTVYLTDLIAAAIISISLYKNLNLITFKRVFNLRLWLLFFIFIVFQTFWAINPLAHLYGAVKLLEMIGLFFALKEIKVQKIWYFFSLALMLVWPSLLAIAQFYVQHSFGGWFYFLGERNFSLLTPGIAKSVILGELKLRPYAVFSHPNSLAGFLLLGWWMLIKMKNAKCKIKNCSEIIKNIINISFPITTAFVLLAIFLTFSRTVWLAGTTALLLYYFAKKISVKRVCKQLPIILLTAGLLLPFLLLKTGNLFHSESFELRKQLFQAALQMFNDNFLTGAGIKNFVPNLANYRLALNRSWLQPVHNIYWLALVELGIAGAFLLFWGLSKTLKQISIKNDPVLLSGLVAVVLLGVNDHYLFTLQQNQLLLVLFLAEVFKNLKIGRQQ